MTDRIFRQTHLMYSSLFSSVTWMSPPPGFSSWVEISPRISLSTEKNISRQHSSMSLSLKSSIGSYSTSITSLYVIHGTSFIWQVDVWQTWSSRNKKLHKDCKRRFIQHVPVMWTGETWWLLNSTQCRLPSCFPVPAKTSRCCFSDYLQ